MFLIYIVMTELCHTRTLTIYQNRLVRHLGTAMFEFGNSFRLLSVLFYLPNFIFKSLFICGPPRKMVKIWGRARHADIVADSYHGSLKQSPANPKGYSAPMYCNLL